MCDFLPKENETITFKGGVGNQTLKQMKNENGDIYQRNNSSENWQLIPKEEILENINKFKSAIEKLKSTKNKQMK